MCPDPALLVAYLDGTLFHRDARTVDEHLLTCANCTALLADMRRQREAESQRSRRSYVRRAAIASAAIALVGIGLWGMTRSRSAPAGDPPPRPAIEPRPAPEPVRPVVQEKAPRVVPATPSRDTAGRGLPPSLRLRRTDEARERAEAGQPARSTAVEIPAEESGIVLRGRNANRRFVWRVRDLAIEHSTDGGATWVIEHTADRPVRAGTFVDANVAWLVGENGLVLRRTSNGWFGTSPPADGHLIAVRASSPSRATVTHDDGRVFTTENGGVSWSTP